jgi:hypothetical protein
MIFLGVDAPQGWCVLDLVHGRGKVLALGSLDSGREALELDGYLKRFCPAAVIIERSEEVYMFGRGDSEPAHVRREVSRGLIATAEVAGELKHTCRISNIRCVMTDAAKIRKVLGIKGRDRTEKDRAVAREIQLRIENWPARSNTHERDSGLAAIWGSLVLATA